METVANTIAEQIGNKAFAMLGANNLIAEERALAFRVGKNNEGITHIRIFLRDDDTYNVEAWKIRGTKVVPRGIVQEVYVENLRPTLTRLTGLSTNL